MLQVLDADYGMYVWPCAVVLAQYVWMQKEEVQRKNVLEVRSAKHGHNTSAACISPFYGQILLTFRVHTQHCTKYVQNKSASSDKSFKTCSDKLSAKYFGAISALMMRLTLANKMPQSIDKY